MGTGPGPQKRDWTEYFIFWSVMAALAVYVIAFFAVLYQ